MKKHLLVEDSFFAGAPALREEFERRFEDPRQTKADRFVWDFWHVPEQYTLVRTPADHFFPASTYRAFLRRLTAWGRETLGCAALTPPWLSYYVEGCQQQLHSDVPHGPWAFVFSLSPRKIQFTGGETMLLRPEVLDYWRSFRDSDDRELSSFVQKVSPRFNRLVVFDPRIPHGVSPVKGTMDPREARLVVHGWFTDPRPFLRGGLKATQAAGPLDGAVARFVEELTGWGQWHGTMSLRLQVSRWGAVTSARLLADTLVPLQGDVSMGPELRRKLLRQFSALRFPRASTGTEITLPLLFR